MPSGQGYLKSNRVKIYHLGKNFDMTSNGRYLASMKCFIQHIGFSSKIEYNWMKRENAGRKEFL